MVDIEIQISISTRFSRGKIWFVDIGPCKRFDIFQLCDDGDWGRGGPYFRRIFRTMDLSRRIPRKPKMGLEGEKNSMMPKKRKKEIQL